MWGVLKPSVVARAYGPCNPGTPRTQGLAQLPSGYSEPISKFHWKLVSVNYWYNHYKSIWTFRSIIDVAVGLITLKDLQCSLWIRVVPRPDCVVAGCERQPVITHHRNSESKSEKPIEHDDVIKWKHFPRYWPFVRGIHRSRWIPRTKVSDAELFMFSLVCVWINNWVNNRVAGDLRRHRAHYDVTVMNIPVSRSQMYLIGFFFFYIIQHNYLNYNLVGLSPLEALGAAAIVRGW